MKRSLFFIFLALCACVNEKYDLSKDLDTSIDVKGQIKLPLGSTEFISLGSLLEQEESDFLQTDEQGGYSICIEDSDSRLGFSYTFDSMKLSPYHFDLGEINVDFSIPGLAPGTPIQSDFSYNKTSPILINSEYYISEKLPEGVTDIRKLSLASSISLNLHLSTGKVVLDKGTQITFPSAFKLAFASSTNDWKLEGNTITSLKDLAISQSGLAINLLLTEMDFTSTTSPTISDGSLLVLLDFVLNGNVSLDVQDFNTAPGSIALSSSLDIKSSVIDSAEVKLDISKISEFSIDGYEFDFASNLPDILKMSCLDFSNPSIKIHISNDSPLAFGIGMDILAKDKSDATLAKASIDADEMNIAASSEQDYYISTLGGVAPEGAKDIVADFSSILKSTPEKIVMDNINLKVSDGFVTIASGQAVGADISYAVDIPFVLGKDFFIGYDYQLHDLNINNLLEGSNMDLNIKSLGFKMSFDNTLPLNLELIAIPVNADSENLEGAVISYGGAESLIIAGSSTSNIELRVDFDNQQALNAFDGLYILINARSASSEGNIQLSSNQGIQLKNMSFNLVCGN